MTAEEFEIFWSATYPLTVPLPYKMRVDYSSRWFRIHSLPESQRYPSTDEELGIILYRQNTMITDLVGVKSDLLLITGEYDYNPSNSTQGQFLNDGSFSHLELTKLKHIELDKLVPNPHLPDENRPGEVYNLFVAEVSWQYGAHDSILKDIANWVTTAMFISVAANCVIAPYDGGMDILVKDTATRDRYKEKYGDWLSKGEAGL